MTRRLGSPSFAAVAAHGERRSRHDRFDKPAGPASLRHVPEAVEVGVGNAILAFDGRVLEVFPSGAISQRIHLEHLAVAVSEPNRKGRRRLTLLGAGQTYVRDFYIEEDQWPTVQPLLDSLEAAGTSVSLT